MHNSIDIDSAGILTKAASDSALTRELVELAGDAGYDIHDFHWTWSRQFNRLGVVRVKYQGQRLAFRAVWDIGSMRMPPRSYRRGSQHHAAILEALAFVVLHARQHGRMLNFEFSETSASCPTLHDSTLTSESSTTLHTS